jgi:hypothetical protein
MNKTHNKIEQIVKKDNDGDLSIDAHIWIEHDGKIIDYTDEEFKRHSAYGTNKIVRKEFDTLLQLQVLAVAKKIYEKKYEELEFMKTLLDINEIELINEVGMCVVKSIDYKKQYLKSKLKIGSLGFIQSNGDIFYEWG